jgi:L-asparaginase II
MTDAPVLVEVVHDGFVESRHRGSVVVLDATGATRLALGEVGARLLPRSCMKPLQAVAMVRAGLALRGEGLALACASHSGEDGHVRLAEQLLTESGVTESDLQGTRELPWHPAVRDEFLRGGGRPSRLRANCSGKHIAMCATCRVNGWSLGDYLDPFHPLHVRIRTTVEDLAGESVTAAAVDGCGAPALAVSLTGLARAYAAIASAPADESEEAAVATAMRENPWTLGGTGREVTRLAEGVSGIVVKDGAEGVVAAALPDGRAVAVKIEDGDLGRRAAFRALATGLRVAGVEGAVLDDRADAPSARGAGPVRRVRAMFGEALGAC